MNKRAKLCLYIFLVCAFFALSVGGYFLFNTRNDQVMVGSRKFQVFNAVAGAARYSISVEDSQNGDSGQAEYEILKEQSSENEFNFTVTVSVGENKIAQEKYDQQITHRYQDTNKIDCKIKNYTIIFFNNDEVIETRTAYLDQTLTNADADIFCCVVNAYFDNLFTKDGAYNLTLIPIDENGEPKENENQQKKYNYTAFYEEEFLKRDAFFYGGKWYDYVIENETELQALVHWAILYRQAQPTFQNGNSVPGYLSFFVKSSQINSGSINRLVTKAIKDYPEYDALEYQNIYGEMKGNLGYLTNFRYYLAENFTKTYLDLAERDTSDEKKDYNEALESLHLNDDLFDSLFIKKEESDERSFPLLSKTENVGVKVYNTEQLFMVVQNGELPLFEPLQTTDPSDTPEENSLSVVEQVWTNALSVLSQINNSDLLTDYEKALNIYRYISGEIVYDWVMYDYMAKKDDFSIRSFGDFSCFYLEGVFLNFDGVNGHYAVCDGLAKAYSLLCNIEGIECIKINGQIKINGEMGNHAWNRVHLFAEEEYNLKDGYYYVDPTWGQGTYLEKIESEKQFYQVLTHTYFLFKHPSDREISFPKNIEKNNPSSNYNYYEALTFEIVVDGESKTIDCVIENDNELSEILTYAQYRADIEDSFVLEVVFTSDYLSGFFKIHQLINAPSQNKTAWFNENGVNGDCKWLNFIQDNSIMLFKIYKSV